MAFNLRNLLSRSRYSVVCLVNGPEVKHRQLSNSNSKKHLYLSTANREQLLAWLIWQRPLNWRIYQRAFSLSWYMLTPRLRPAHNQNKQLIKKNKKAKINVLFHLALRHSFDCDPCLLRNSLGSKAPKPVGSAETKIAELTLGRLLHRASRCSSHSRLCVWVCDQRMC